nr:thioredoxin-like 2, chloroplastic [Ipomoea batatas]
MTVSTVSSTERTVASVLAAPDVVARIAKSRVFLSNRSFRKRICFAADSPCASVDFVSRMARLAMEREEIMRDFGPFTNTSPSSSSFNNYIYQFHQVSQRGRKITEASREKVRIVAGGAQVPKPKKFPNPISSCSTNHPRASSASGPHAQPLSFLAQPSNAPVTSPMSILAITEDSWSEKDEPQDSSLPLMVTYADDLKMTVGEYGLWMNLTLTSCCDDVVSGSNRFDSSVIVSSSRFNQAIISPSPTTSKPAILFALFTPSPSSSQLPSLFIPTT